MENVGCGGDGRQLQLDCLNCRNGLEHGDTGRDMFVLTTEIGLAVCGEGTAVENPVKSLALTPISFRGVILFLENSLLDVICVPSAGASAFLSAPDFAALTAGWS